MQVILARGGGESRSARTDVQALSAAQAVRLLKAWPAVDEDGVRHGRGEGDNMRNNGYNDLLPKDRALLNDVNVRFGDAASNTPTSSCRLTN
jgi:hypothetical protein